MPLTTSIWFREGISDLTEQQMYIVMIDCSCTLAE